MEIESALYGRYDMTLRKKNLIIILSTFLALIVLLYSISILILFKSYKELETASVTRECRQIEHTIENEIELLNSKAADWAVWDDTCYFIRDLNKSYITSNLTDTTLPLLNMSFMFYIDRSGKVLYSLAYDLDNDRPVPPPAGINGLLSADSRFTDHGDDNTPFTGVIILHGSVALFSSRPILTSMNEGPSRGTLLCGRFIDDGLIKKISRTTRLDVSAYKPGDTALPSDIKPGKKIKGAKEPVFIKPADSDNISGYLPLRDIYGNTAKIFRVNLAREVYNQGVTSINHLIILILCTVVIFTITFIVIIERIVLRRIVLLNEEINTIRESADLNLRVTVDGKDEISSLSTEINRMLGAINTATERARRTDKRLSVTVNSISEGVITTDTEGMVLLINPVAEKLTGLQPGGWESRPLDGIFNLTVETGSGGTSEFLVKILEQKKTVPLPEKTRLISRSGRDIFIEGEGAPVIDENGNIAGAVIVFRDMTEKLKIQEEMLRAQKLKSIQTLAGGIAHDFNNILTSILGNISLLKIMRETDPESREILNQAENACFRAGDLTVQLLTFSKGGTPVKKNSSVSEIIRQTADFTLRGSNVKSDIRLSGDLWSVEIDEGQIHQVLNNLIINADQAMPEGGVITISAENKIVDNETPMLLKSYPQVASGKYVRIIIRDNGLGIPEKNIGRIFDPYFTTKPLGNGLGLAVVYSIIKKHNGFIDVESAAGKGTVFYIYLPSTGTTATKTEIEEKQRGRGEGKILITDDDIDILKSLAKMLEYLGYKTEGAKTGQDAIKKYREALSSDRPFDAVIMDLTIPGDMGGKEATENILAADPDATIIVSSGYSDDAAISDYRKYGFRGVLLKPYNMNQLSEVLDEVINGKG